MQDILYVAGTIGFFALMLAFVVGCDRIIGADDAPERRGGPMSLDDLICLVVAVAVTGYLVLALLAPERL